RLEDVVAAVGLVVEVGRSAYPGPAIGTVRPLVAGFADHGLDAATPQGLAGGAGGVGLVAAQHVRSRAWPARPWPGDGQPVQQRAEHWGVPALAGPAQEHQGQAVAVDELMDLGREPAAGATEGAVRRLLAQILVVPQRPLWCARGGCRAGAHGRSWSRPRPTSPAPRARRRGPAARRGCDPRSRPQPRPGGASTPSARDRNRWARRARRSRTGSGR